VKELLAYQRSMQELVRGVAAHADAIVASSAGRRRATEMITSSYEHIRAELIAHQLVGVARCHADWIELDGVGHCPQLDVPLETAQLITLAIDS